MNDEMKNPVFPARLIKNGGSLGVTIPDTVVKFKELKLGDIIMIEIHGVVEKQKTE